MISGVDRKKKIKKDPTKAATLIQAVYRSYIVRKKYKKLLEKVKRRKFTIEEVLSTEKVYLESLRITVEVVTFYLKLVLIEIFRSNESGNTNKEVKGATKYRKNNICKY
jgi:hypothetical protein